MDRLTDAPLSFQGLRFDTGRTLKAGLVLHELHLDLHRIDEVSAEIFLSS